MDRIGLFYAPAKGSTEKIAKIIAEKIGKDKVDLILVDENTEIEAFKPYDKLIMGISTVGRENWDAEYKKVGWDFFLPKLDNADFTNKTVALFGLGNHILYADYFVDAMGELGQKIIEKGGKLVGLVDKSNYEFNHSKAIINNKFMGLPLDEDTQEDLSEKRLNEWLEDIKSELNF